MKMNHQQVSTALIYFKCFLILASAITGCIFICTFTFLVGVLIGKRIKGSSARGLKICATFAAIKKYNSLIKSEKEKHHKLHTIKVLNEFVLINNALKEYNDMKQEIIKTFNILLIC